VPKLKIPPVATFSSPSGPSDEIPTLQNWKFFQLDGVEPGQWLTIVMACPLHFEAGTIAAHPLFGEAFMTLTLSSREIRIVARGLLKRDRPRLIDRHIDYFGGPAGQAARLVASHGEHGAERPSRRAASSGGA
jgi:hypothetical protein